MQKHASIGKGRKMGRTIDADDFLKQSTELYEHAGWDEREVHFSLADLRCNLEMMSTVDAIPVEFIKHLYKKAIEYRDGFCKYSPAWDRANEQAIGLNSVLQVWGGL